MIGTDEENLEKRVGEATGGKAIYGGADAVAGEMTGTLISCVRNEGQVLIYGDYLTLSKCDAFNGNTHAIFFVPPCLPWQFI